MARDVKNLQRRRRVECRRCSAFHRARNSPELDRGGARLLGIGTLLSIRTMPKLRYSHYASAELLQMAIRETRVRSAVCTSEVRAHHRHGSSNICPPTAVSQKPPRNQDIAPNQCQLPRFQEEWSYRPLDDIPLYGSSHCFWYVTAMITMQLQGQGQLTTQFRSASNTH